MSFEDVQVDLSFSNVIYSGLTRQDYLFVGQEFFIEGKVPVKTITIEVPNLFGDHHVQEIRNLLLGIPGVQDVYASSCFQVVEVTYDPAVLNDLEISIKLDQAGYLSEWSLPVESSTSTYNQQGMQTFFRHTSVFEATRQTVNFSQSVPYSGRPLWNCPGMGVIKNVMED